MYRDLKYHDELNNEYSIEYKKFTNEDYAELQRNLILYKNGNRESAEYIIKAFHKILNCYTEFIVLNKIPSKKQEENRNVATSSLYKFIRLFGKYKEAETAREGLNISREYIHKMFNRYEYGEIYNQLVLALLNMANNYKIITDKNDPRYKPNGTFHTYVKQAFHFEAFHFLTNLANDPLNLDYNIDSIDKYTEQYEEEDILPMFESYDSYNDTTFSSPMLVDQKALDKYSLMIDYIDRQIIKLILKIVI